MWRRSINGIELISTYAHSLAYFIFLLIHRSILRWYSNAIWCVPNIAIFNVHLPSKLPSLPQYSPLPQYTFLPSPLTPPQDGFSVKLTTDKQTANQPKWKSLAQIMCYLYSILFTLRICTSKLRHFCLIGFEAYCTYTKCVICLSSDIKDEE